MSSPHHWPRAFAWFRLVLAALALPSPLATAGPAEPSLPTFVSRTGAHLDLMGRLVDGRAAAVARSSERTSPLQDMRWEPGIAPSFPTPGPAPSSDGTWS